MESKPETNRIESKSPTAKETRGIAHKNKDVIAKVLTQNYQNKSLAVYGLTHLPKIKRMLSPNYPIVTATEYYAYNVFILEDDTLLILEYESKPIWEDFLKYGKYVIYAVERLRLEAIRVTKVVVAILYTGDVQSTAKELDLGGFRIQVEQVYLSKFDTDAIYAELKAKVEAKQRLTDEEVMKFIILPLTQPNKKLKQGLIEDTVALAKQVSDDDQQAFILAGILTAANKFIDQEFANNVKEWMKLLKVVRSIVEEAHQEKAIEIAKRMVKRGLSDEAIASDTGLDEEVVRELRIEPTLLPA